MQRQFCILHIITATETFSGRIRHKS